MNRGRAWSLAARQHGVVARWQLLELGFSGQSIKHRAASGRLHPVRRGVYAVGRPELTQNGEWMAAVLSCGPQAVLSHLTAAALWELLPSWKHQPIHVSVPASGRNKGHGIVVHRRASLGGRQVTRLHGIPVTAPVLTLTDIATQLGRGQLEAAINEADKRDLVCAEELRNVLDEVPRTAGLGVLRSVLDRWTFALTDSELERRFLPIARDAGLPRPETGRWVNGFKVDFYWPELGLVVETDGLRYHRTAAQQARDRVRDQAHTRAGLTQLRFTHAQVTSEPAYVEATLTEVVRRLRRK